MSVFSEDLLIGLRMSGVYRHPFYDRFDDETELPPNKDRMLCANERNIIVLSATIRNKSDWWTKAQDPAIRAKWKEEAVGASVPFGEMPLNETEVEYALDELSWYAELRDEVTGIEPSIFHRIWQSDSLIDDNLHSQLLKSVAALENVPDDRKDWHPRADGQVLDLVHPSLYCIIYGRTVLRDSYDTRILTAPVTDSLHDSDDLGRPDSYLSELHSWLPTDFAISPDGSSARALAYINNLSPDSHPGMYPVIEQIVARFVPMWERVLGETRVGAEFHLPQRTAEASGYSWVEKPQVVLEREEKRKARVEAKNADGSGSEDSDYSDEEGSTDWWSHKDHDFVMPAISDSFVPHKKPEPVDLKGRDIQVIVKLANIHLTPEKPVYPGGSWHVEGMMNEAIVSTGIYYYDEENITESSLAFRMAVFGDLNLVAQHDSMAATLMFGIGKDEPTCQVLGSVVTKQGRCIAFPNLYQHQIQPFELVDKFKPGHRKILALFLVDPALRHPRPSTSDIPSQQRDWMRVLFHDIAAGLGAKHGMAQAKGLGKLPVELLDMIIERADWLMSREQAEEYRLQLMDERSTMNEVNDQLMFQAEFNMCEH